MLDSETLNNLILKVNDKITEEIIVANRTGALEDLMIKYGLLDIYSEAESSLDIYDHNRSCIVVISIDISNQDKLRLTAKKNFGVDPRRIQFIQWSNNLEITKFRFNTGVSDIIVGPIPHKSSNMGNNTSLITMIEKEQSAYPKLLRMVSSAGDLTWSQNAFEQCLARSNMVNYCIK